MTALKWITNKAKSIRKGHKTMTWKAAIKKAGVEYRASHKAKPVKKTVKKKTVRRKVVKSITGNYASKRKSVPRAKHIDTKSHNVNVRVISGKIKGLITGAAFPNRYSVSLHTLHDDFDYASGGNKVEMNNIYMSAYKYKARDRYERELVKGETVDVHLYDNKLDKLIKCKRVRMGTRGKLYFESCTMKYKGYKYQRPIGRK